MSCLYKNAVCGVWQIRIIVPDESSLNDMNECLSGFRREPAPSVWGIIREIGRIINRLCWFNMPVVSCLIVICEYVIYDWKHIAMYSLLDCPVIAHARRDWYRLTVQGSLSTLIINVREFPETADKSGCVVHKKALENSLYRSVLLRNRLRDVLCV